MLPSLLDEIHIASPCPVSWDIMSGDERVRFCPRCRLHVYNLSGMSQEESEHLLRREEGRMCVRFYHRADGKVMTDDCPGCLDRIRRQLPTFLGLTIALFVVLFLGLAGLILGAQRDGANDSADGPLQRVLRWFNLGSSSPTMGKP
jgi:hypothetical protein